MKKRIIAYILIIILGFSTLYLPAAQASNQWYSYFSGYFTWVGENIKKHHKKIIAGGIIVASAYYIYTKLNQRIKQRMIKEQQENEALYKEVGEETIRTIAEFYNESLPKLEKTSDFYKELDSYYHQNYIAFSKTKNNFIRDVTALALSSIITPYRKSYIAQNDVVVTPHYSSADTSNKNDKFLEFLRNIQGYYIDIDFSQLQRSLQLTITFYQNKAHKNPFFSKQITPSAITWTGLCDILIKNTKREEDKKEALKKLYNALEEAVKNLAHKPLPPIERPHEAQESIGKWQEVNLEKLQKEKELVFYDWQEFKYQSVSIAPNEFYDRNRNVFLSAQMNTNNTEIKVKIDKIVFTLQHDDMQQEVKNINAKTYTLTYDQIINLFVKLLHSLNQEQLSAELSTNKTDRDLIKRAYKIMITISHPDRLTETNLKEICSLINKTLNKGECNYKNDPFQIIRNLYNQLGIKD